MLDLMRDPDATGIEETDRGTWAGMHTGGRFYPFDPRPEEVFIEDIAAHLSCIVRYGGATGPKNWFSVAQHCVIGSFIAEDRYGVTAARAFLLHDAPEYVLGDMIRPVKYTMPNYRELEANIWTAIADRFGVSRILPAHIKEIDNLMLACEKRDLLPLSERWLNMPDADPDVIINPLSPIDAYKQFAKRFMGLWPNEKPAFDLD